MDKSEAKIQQEIVKFYRNTYCLKHHNPRCMVLSVPNESNRAHALKLMQTGLYPGCADLIIFHTKLAQKFKYEETVTLFIEVKTTTGIQSPKQKGFEEHCKQMFVRYEIVRSLDQFKQVIENL